MRQGFGMMYLRSQPGFEEAYQNIVKSGKPLTAPPVRPLSFKLKKINLNKFVDGLKNKVQQVMPKQEAKVPNWFITYTNSPWTQTKY